MNIALAFVMTFLLLGAIASIVGKHLKSIRQESFPMLGDEVTTLH